MRSRKAHLLGHQQYVILRILCFKPLAFRNGGTDGAGFDQQVVDTIGEKM